jgi:hypothetical protein
MNVKRSSTGLSIKGTKKLRKSHKLSNNFILKVFIQLSANFYLTINIEYYGGMRKMVKSGNVIEEWKIIRGKRVKVKSQLRGIVYFPEKPDGSIDLTNWYLTEKEARFFEAVERDEELKRFEKAIEEAYKKRNQRWNELCDLFGIEDRKIPIPKSDVRWARNR